MITIIFNAFPPLAIAGHPSYSCILAIAVFLKRWYIRLFQNGTYKKYTILFIFALLLICL
jgi:hypothetical protein